MKARAGVRAAALVALPSPPGLAFQDPVRALQSGHGGIVRGPAATRRIALEFTGHEFAGGGAIVLDELARHGARASFFLTGDSLRTPEFAPLVRRIVREGHYRMNGNLLLLHIGAGSGRIDKIHARLRSLLDDLSARGYRFVRVDELLR